MNEAESTLAIAAKLAPPASVTAASIAGLPVSDLVLWITLIYTLLMIAHKLFAMYRDARDWWRE
jgi:hypothetical protein